MMRVKPNSSALRALVGTAMSLPLSLVSAVAGAFILSIVLGAEYPGALSPLLISVTIFVAVWAAMIELCDLRAT